MPFGEEVLARRLFAHLKKGESWYVNGMGWAKRAVGRAQHQFKSGGVPESICSTTPTRLVLVQGCCGLHDVDALENREHHAREASASEFDGKTNRELSFAHDQTTRR